MIKMDINSFIVIKEILLFNNLIMIYVLKSGAVDDSTGEDRLFLAIKIGYTKSWKTRSSAYRTENPTPKVLFLIDGGNEDDERNLHNHFKKYQIDEGREWFYYNDEIIEFFKTHDNICKIRDTVLEVASRKNSREIRPFELNVMAGLIAEKSGLSFDAAPKIANEIKDLNLKNFQAALLYIRQTYSDNADSIIDSLGEWYIGRKDLSERAQRFLNASNMLPNSVLIRLLAEKRYDGIREEVIKFMPFIIRKSYECLGIQWLRDNKYSMVKIMKRFELPVMDDEDILSDLIYQEFHEGDRLSKKFIKDRLRNIYQDLGLEDLTPKATELGKWFELRDLMVPDEFGKRKAGFLLLRKLE